MMRTLIVCLTFVCAAQATAQTAQPYAGEQDRAIAALSAQRIEGLRAGRGLGYAKAAELNGFPGPMHVLEMADNLGLDDATRERIASIRANMLEQAIPLGEQLIAAEQVLDDLFTKGTPDASAVADATRAIGLIEANLRAVHLKAHLETTPLLTRHQRMIYSKARGYGGANGHNHGSGHRHD